MTAVPNITLNNGVEIPQLGFGVFQIEPEKTKDATLAALEVGYRHIDTAEMYGNEKEVGEAVRASGIDRGDVFVTSKLNNGFHAYDDALRRLRPDAGGPRHRVPRPVPRALAAARASATSSRPGRRWRRSTTAGRVRAIGVSNFQPTHLRRIHGETNVTPAVNQIEVHPYLAHDEVRAFDAEHGIATEAWSPIAQGKVLDDPTIVRIAESARQDARPRSRCAGTCSAATSSSRSR